MSTDRELLEWAAKAAGESRTRYIDNPLFGIGMIGEGSDGGIWNPLANDGDALRLAVRLQIQVTPGTYNKDEFTAYSHMHVEARERWAACLQDEYTATRRAIVRAAAEIGKHSAPSKEEL